MWYSGIDQHKQYCRQLRLIYGGDRKSDRVDAETIARLGRVAPAFVHNVAPGVPRELRSALDRCWNSSPRSPARSAGWSASSRTPGASARAGPWAPISGSVHGGTCHALRGEGPAVPPVIDRETFCTRLGPTRKLRHA